MEDNNNLENFFRQKFAQKIEPQEWNIPDNDIWDKIASEIPDEKRKKNRILIIPLAIALGSLVMSIFYAHENYHKKDQIQFLQKELIKCGKSTEVKGENPAEFSPNVSSIKKLEKSSNVKLVQQKTLSFIDSNFSMSPSKLASVKNEYTSDINVSEVFKNQPKNDLVLHPELLSSANQEKIEITKEIFKNRELVQPKTIDNISIFHIVSKQEKSIISIDKKSKILRSTKKGKDYFQIGVRTGYIFWRDKEVGSFDNPLSELLINETSIPSLTYGLHLSKSLGSHWAVNAGVEIYSRHQKSIYAINLPYSTSNEIVVGSEYENRFSHSLPTGLGNINTSLVLSRNIDNVVEDNENVLLDFSLINEIKALSVPLSISYFLKDAGNSFFICGGINSEFIIQNRISEVSTQSHHTLVKDKSINVDYNSSQVNTFNLSATTGLGYQKLYENGLGLVFSSMYGVALNNTFSSGKYQHKIDQVSLKISVTKNL